MAKFMIGGAELDCPRLNLRANRVALAKLLPALQSGDQDAIIGATLDVLAARLASHPDPACRLTAADLEDRIVGLDELEALTTSVSALLAESGFAPKGEVQPATAEEASPATT